MRMVCGEQKGTRACNVCLFAMWMVHRAGSRCVSGDCTYGDHRPLGSPPQSRTLDSWFAVVVGRRIVEPCSLSMIGIDTLARTHTHTHTHTEVRHCCSADRAVDVLCVSERYDLVENTWVPHTHTHARAHTHTHTHTRAHAHPHTLHIPTTPHNWASNSGHLKLSFTAFS